MNFAAHRDPAMFRKSYMPGMITVEGQASYLAQPLRNDCHKDLRGMSLRHRPQLWQALLATLKADLERRPDFVALDAEIEVMTAKIGTVSPEDSGQERACRKNLYEQSRQLTAMELQAWRKKRPSKPTHSTSFVDHHRTRFDRVRHLMLERDHLASSLFSQTSLRSVEGQAVLRDLISLYRSDSRVAYYPSTPPEMGRCPSPRCGLRMDRFVFRHLQDSR